MVRRWVQRRVERPAAQLDPVPPAAPGPPAVPEPPPASTFSVPGHPLAWSILLYTATFLVLVAAVWVFAQLLAMVSAVVVPILLALLLTGLLMPIQVLLNHRLSIPRHAASAITVVGAVTLLSIGIYLAGSELAYGIARLRSSMVIGINQLEALILNSPFDVGREQILEAFDQGREWLLDNRGELSRGLLQVGTTAGGMVASGLLVLVNAFFFLAQGDRLWAWLMCLLPGTVREPAHEAFRRGWVTLSTYARMQIVVSGVDAIGIGLGAYFVGLPFVVPLTALVFVMCFIPILGALLSGVLVVLVALVFKGLIAALIMLAIVLAVQQLEGNVLSPFLMGKAVRLHPLVVILGVAMGTFLWGLLGALFTVPFLAVANTVISYLQGRDMFPMLAGEGSALTDSGRRLASGYSQPRLPRRVGQATPQWQLAMRNRLVRRLSRVRREVTSRRRR